MTIIDVISAGSIIEGCLFLGVAEDIMCLINFLEFLGSSLLLLIRLIVSVGVVLERHLAVRILNIFVASTLLQAKHLVEVFLLGSFLSFLLCML